MLIRSSLAVLAFGCALLPGSVLLCNQETKSEQVSTVSDSAPRLRRIVFKHPGCVTCNDSVLDGEEQYLKRSVKERPSVESVYKQKVVDDMKQALENFWREQGIDVEVSTNLTQVCGAGRAAVLEIQIYRKY